MSIEKQYENSTHEVEEIKIDFYPDPDYQFQGWLRVYGKLSTLGIVLYFIIVCISVRKIFKEVY